MNRQLPKNLGEIRPFRLGKIDSYPTGTLTGDKYLRRKSITAALTQGIRITKPETGRIAQNSQSARSVKIKWRTAYNPIIETCRLFGGLQFTGQSLSLTVGLR